MRMVQSRSLVESSHLGVIVLTGFAVVWVVAAAMLSSLPMAVTLAAAVGVLLVGVAIILAASRRRFDPTDESRSPIDPRHRRSVFIVANIAQAVLLWPSPVRPGP